MKKIIIISLIAASLVIMIGAAGYYLLRGTLTINAQPIPFTVVIGNKEHEVGKSFSENLLIGPHHATVKKDFYQNADVKTMVSLNKTTTENVTLKIDRDGQSLLNNSIAIVNSWIKFTKDSDSVSFLNSMRVHTNNDVYSSISETVSQANVTNSAGVTTVIQEVFGPIGNISLSKQGENGATATVSVKKAPGNDISVESIVISYSKIGSSWKATNITYNY